MFRNLVVECTNGSWVMSNYSDNNITQALTENTPNRLQDVLCTAQPDDLVLDEALLHEPGVVLVCAKQDRDHLVFTEREVMVMGDNYCALLCNYHHVLTIMPRLQHDGVARWWVVRHGQDKGEEAIGKDGPGGTNILCW